MELSVIILPLFSFLSLSFFGYRLGSFGACIITCSNMFVTMLISWILFFSILYGKEVHHIQLMDWILCDDIQIRWGFLFDSVTAVMLIVVNTISFLVHLYSTEYMKEDPHLPRFMAYLSFFTFAMLILVTADNFVQMFLGWEAVGIASFLLISFWFTRIQANKSALKAVLINKIGDFFLFFAILLIFFYFKTTNYSAVFAISPLISDKISFFGLNCSVITLINFFLFLGAFGKSAQIGLHSWLPDAMEGPTPVSALIHAATMVTAGVFLIIRCSPLIDLCNISLITITIFGSLTAFMSATIGVLQNDIKKIIAYSTCSQLGYMVFICGLSNYSVGLFHLMNHAFFKALLFLCAGSVIHAIADEQDIRKMGGFLKILPLTYIMMFVASLSLAGFPFLTGFYSKDVILELAYSHYTIHGNFAYWLGTLAAFLTSFYSFRLLYFTFYSKINTSKIIAEKMHDSPLRMAIPFFILFFGSVFVGFLFKDLFIGAGNTTFEGSIFVNGSSYNSFEAEFLPVYIKLIPVIFSILGILICLFLYSYFSSLKIWSKIYKNDTVAEFYFFVVNKWQFDNIYNHYIVKPLLYSGYTYTFKKIDRGFFELLGPFGLVRLTKKISYNINKLQTGFIFNYAFATVIGVVVLLPLIFPKIIVGLNVNVDFQLLFILFIGALINILLSGKNKNQKKNVKKNVW